MPRTSKSARQEGGGSGAAAPSPPSARGVSLVAIALLLLAMVTAYMYPLLTAEPAVPELPDKWWSAGEPPARPDTSVQRYKIWAPAGTMDDIRSRLARAESRLTPPLEGSNFTYGFNSEQLKKVLDHWSTKYDWQKRLRALNELPHFRTNIDGLDIHFVHVRPEVPSDQHQVVPLLLLHGWPGSFVEFRRALQLLSRPRPGHRVVFELICPSLPGYGFSSAAAKPGLGTPEVAAIMRKLMLRLGFEKFFVQGGDWGSMITNLMGTMYPDNVRGAHMNMVTPGSTSPRMWLLLAVGKLFPSVLGSEFFQKRYYPVGAFASQLARETGYAHLQATKPDTVGVALGDSPAGLAAYILEKFSSWTDMENVARPDGGLPGPYDIDDLLDNVMIYWVSNSITSSMRLYAESMGRRVAEMRLHDIPCRVPVGLLFADKEPYLFSPNMLGNKFPDIVSARELPEGGHFLAMEKPQLLVEHVFVTVTAILQREERDREQQKQKEQQQQQKQQEQQKQKQQQKQA
ncbi:juvenile hormone epoxide hydrolase 1-like [Amphibalanus amphitrite]|uniref:juvenile hormone epoxide hydrolase 1-like n=1 Tax=Amphibalanus amphitrite TaxID=1232801 RepID=UPI001C90B6A4|nr:juvenile hormone epoxide hydrolase 1-like [Amphibalanus amphitrite]